MKQQARLARDRRRAARGRERRRLHHPWPLRRARHPERHSPRARRGPRPLVDEIAHAVAPAEALLAESPTPPPATRSRPPPAPRHVARRLIREEVRCAPSSPAPAPTRRRKSSPTRISRRSSTTTDEWIAERTGIRERRMAAPEEATSRHGRRRPPSARWRWPTLAPRISTSIIVGTISARHAHARPARRCVQAQAGGARRPSPSTSPPRAPGSLYALVHRRPVHPRPAR